MATSSGDVELTEKGGSRKSTSGSNGQRSGGAPASSTSSSTSGGAGGGSPDPVTGNANVISMGEYRDKLAHEGVIEPRDKDEEAGEVETKKGFGGSWKCAIALTVGLLVVIVFTIVVAVTSTKHKDHEDGHGLSEEDMKGSSLEKSAVYAEAAVVADVPECSEMGKGILLQGGSAVDAAITTQLCIGLVNSQSSGLGGGFFMLIYDAASGAARFLDARETAPSAANDSYAEYEQGISSPYGINKTAIPGEVAGLWQAHQMYGKLPWRDLFAPVIELAQNGYTATEHLAATLASMESLDTYPGDWNIYKREDGSVKQAGDLVQNLALAETLRAISENGAQEFYTGETARRLHDEIQTFGGILTMDDLAGYSVKLEDALTAPFGDDYNIIVPSNPSGGPIVRFIAQTMQAFNITKEDFGPDVAKRTKTVHRFLEVCKFAFGLRSHLGDEATLGVQKALGALSSSEYSRDVVARIPNEAVTFTNTSYYHVLPEVSSTLGGTSHLNVLAANGDAVVSTTSVNYRFGCRVRSPSTGIIFNNEMGDFSLSNTSPNYVRPGKRPLSAMSGTMVTDREGRVKLLVGTAGSKKIITANAWTILSTLIGQVPLSETVDEYRIHAELRPEAYESYESGYNEEIVSALTGYGHSLHKLDSKYIFSVVQAILRASSGEVLAYSDPRKRGAAAGY